MYTKFERLRTRVGYPNIDTDHYRENVQNSREIIIEYKLILSAPLAVELTDFLKH